MPDSPEAETHSFTVPESLEGERIDRTVSMLTDVSRRIAADLIAEGDVTVDSKVVNKPSIKVSVGSTISVVVPPPEAGPTADPSVELDVVFEDDHVAVINKPAGLVIHPGAGISSGTLVNGLIHRYPEVVAAAAEAHVDAVRPGIVHRLDKGTSGVLMVARSAEAHRSLSGQLADRTVLRRYLTVVEGDLETNEGLIDGPLGRSPRDATRQAVVVGGREARTRYEVAERFDTEVGSFTLLVCRLETGRTHQIRAHLEAIGHPVAGDERYGSTSSAALGLSRPFLHAADLGFEHPETEELMMFSVDLPEDLTGVVDQLRGAAEAKAASDADAGVANSAGNPARNPPGGESPS